ncbi:PREDICTED: uncharacterized protein LOC18588403 isoform X1 [Theobroma cacao]|uniref:Uncharacterized protein LOC18588403 isoform X1 n=1 Tax=Theobroma cacao TaxID=3641 RepID=A0AB32UPH4_THECC|nr:PREDICTED: uncharacterized protein LOC18588403 isoform X1 [Theobroma cacao]
MEPSHSQMETPPLSSKESRINRYKPIWRILLISNLALGAYMFAKARKKNSSIVDNRPAKIEMEPEKSKTEADVSSAPLTPTPVYEEPPIFPVVATPPKVLEPIPEDQRRELFEWILEEKRKVKPKDPEERKRIDEEKAILKQFMRSKSMPRI